MAHLDRMLRLKRGTSNYWRRRGLFEAQPTGSGFVITEDRVKEIGDLIYARVYPPVETDGTPLVSVQEAAARLGVADHTIYTQVERGKLKAIKIKRRVYIYAVSVEEYRINRIPKGVILLAGREKLMKNMEARRRARQTP